MTTSVLFGVGDGVTADYLDLTDGDNYDLRDGSFEFRDGVFRCLLDIVGSSHNQLIANYRALWTKINQAKAAAGPNGRGTPVTISARMGTSGGYVYMDVLDGVVTVPASTITGPLILSDFWQAVELVLRCEPFARGEVITDSVSATLTNGNAGYLYRADVPGDVPALAQVKLVDVSTGGKIINRVRLGVRSFDSMTATDFDGVLDDTANSPGVSGAEANTVGGNRSRVTTSDIWEDVADFAGGAAGFNNGEFDLWARVRDSSALGVPTGLGLRVAAGGTLTAGTYTLRVVTIDGAGSLSSASDADNIAVVNATNDRILVTWAVGDGAANHRVYYKRDTDAWEWFATGSALGTYNLDSNAGTAGDPPTEGATSAAGAQVRALVGMASLTTTYALRAVTPPLTGSQWCLVYLGRTHLPPVTRGHELSQQAWKVTLQAKSGGTSTPTMDVDALWLFPADEYQVVAEYPGLALATLREWIVSTNRYGYTSGILRNTSTQAEAGQIDVTGAIYAPPGDCLFTFAVDITSGVNDVVDAKWTATLTLTPRYRYLRGAP